MLAVTTLFSLLTVITAAPTRRWADDLGSNFFMTNGFDGNQLVSSYIGPQGMLETGCAVWTGGNGSASINDPAPFEPHPDPLLGSSSVVVAGDQVMVVNAGSNSFSVLDIDPMDPAKVTLDCVYPSYGDFPASIGVSSDGKMACVVNSGASNGFSCYEAGWKDDGSWGKWTHMSAWDRSLGLNLTTPPHGPVGGTPSQIKFASDMSALFVLVKGKLPMDLNNPTGEIQKGYIATYPISWVNGSYMLAYDCTQTTATFPFAIVEDWSAPDIYFFADVSTGYATWKESATGPLNYGVISDEKAACWAAQSHRTQSFYVVDTVGCSNITEVSVDTATLNGTVLSAQSAGINASATDISVFSGPTYDYLYVLTPGYEAVQAYIVRGPGDFYMMQQFNLSCMPSEIIPNKGFVGQAVYYKRW